MDSSAQPHPIDETTVQTPGIYAYGFTQGILNRDVLTKDGSRRNVTQDFNLYLDGYEPESKFPFPTTKVSLKIFTTTDSLQFKTPVQPYPQGFYYVRLNISADNYGSLQIKPFQNEIIVPAEKFIPALPSAAKMSMTEQPRKAA